MTSTATSGGHQLTDTPRHEKTVDVETKQHKPTSISDQFQFGEVRLLQTVKIPAGYKKVIRGRVQGGVGSTLMLFTSTVNRPDLLLADGALEGGDGECTTLILENHGAEKLRLKKGTILGTVSPVDEVTVRSSGDSHEGAVDSLEWGEGATSNVDHTEPRSDVAAMGLNMEVDGGENLAMVTGHRTHRGCCPCHIPASL